MIPILEPPVLRWECPNCDTTDTTREQQPHTRFHRCPGIGITAPMVPAGSGARVSKNVRDDYVGKEDVQYDDAGTPIMSVLTEYPDGHTDLAVLAPTVIAHTGL